MSDSTEVLIVGAGPTGLVLALWLTRLGVRVRIVDKVAEPGTTSRAVAVQARTLELYRQIGLADAVTQAGVKVAAINLWVGGSKAARVPIAALGQGLSPYPYPLIYPQDAHERLLIDALARSNVRVERPVELLRFEQTGGGVTARLKTADGAEETCAAQYIAGCDGAHSTVREQLGVGFPGGTYSGLFYVADVAASGGAADGELHVDLEDADFVAVFPMKGAGRLRLIGPVSWDSSRERRDLTFEDVSTHAIGNLDLRVDKLNWFSTYRVHHRVATRFAQGRAFLLGDAAHVHSPVGGQGMNTGIGDAVNLGWKLADVLHGRMGASLLGTYETERIAFARRLVATTDRAFTIITRQGRLARFVRTRVVPRVLPFVFRIGRARRAMFRVVSQIGVSYRGSALSAGAAGDVAGGDRLPWVEIEAGRDNFAPLDSMAWQAHVYGDVPEAVRDACADLHLPLHRITWHDRMRGAGLSRDALYVLRPDGYVGLAQERADPATLRDYISHVRQSARSTVNGSLLAARRAGT